MKALKHKTSKFDHNGIFLNWLSSGHWTSFDLKTIQVRFHFSRHYTVRFNGQVTLTLFWPPWTARALIYDAKPLTHNSTVGFYTCITTVLSLKVKCCLPARASKGKFKWSRGISSGVFRFWVKERWKFFRSHLKAADVLAHLSNGSSASLLDASKI